MALSRLPVEMSRIVLTLQVSPYAVFGFVVIVLLFLGMIMDVPAMVLLSIPIFFPVMMTVGFDPIWFGVVVIVMSEVGLITPPVGMNVFIVAGASDVPLYDIFKGILPFLGALIVAVAIMTIFPQICTFLPNLAYK